MRALGLDCGRHMGWAVGETPWRLVACGLINSKPKKFESEGYALLRAQKALQEILLTYKPEVVYFEKLHAHTGTYAAQVLGTFLSMVMTEAARAEIPYCGLDVGAIKKHATGRHAASKELMVKAAERLWPEAEIQTPDVADALHIMRLGLSKL